MSVQVRRRRESAAFLSTFVGAQGELLIDTTNNRVQVHDGTTPGGWPAARLDEVTPATRFAVVTDANYTVLATDGVVALTTALTAPRTLTLPPAASVKSGKSFRIVDQAGGISAANTLTLAATGADKLNGAAAAVFVAPYTDFPIVSDGVSKWTYDIQGIARGGTGATSANTALIALGAIGRTSVADANYSAQPTDRTIAFTSLTAARTVTLPPASTYPTGTQLLVADESGACSAVNALTVARVGTDVVATIAGIADRIDLYPYVPVFDLAADRAGVNVTSGVAGALAKILVYASDAQGRPDRLMLESATLDCSTVAAAEASVALTLRKGTQYWVGVRYSSTATLSAFATYTTPDLDAGAIGTAPSKAVRRNLAFATAAPASWAYVASESVSISVPAVWFRST